MPIWDDQSGPRTPDPGDGPKLLLFIAAGVVLGLVVIWLTSR